MIGFSILLLRSSTQHSAEVDAERLSYVVGGFIASYMRRGDFVQIPVRLGVGARLGVNAGYIRFSERSRLLPF